MHYWGVGGGGQLAYSTRLETETSNFSKKKSKIKELDIANIQFAMGLLYKTQDS